MIITLLIIIIISSTLHEAMHAYVSLLLGDDTAHHAGRLSLNPLVHIDPIFSVALPLMLGLLGLPIIGAAKPVPFNPARLRRGNYDVALVAASGPLTNLVLALAVGLPLRFVAMPESLNQLAITWILVNLGFGIFNLLPIPPLDGSRVLYAFGPDFIRSWLRQAERSGIWLIFAIVIFFSGFLSQFIGTMISTIFQLITGFDII